MKYDIVIAGGGMIGTSLALALAPLGLRVAIIEPVPRGAAQQPSFDDRSTALSRSTQRMYSAMGLWDEIAAAATPVKNIHVSDQGRFGFSHIDAEEQKVEALGYVVINRVLGSVLQQALDKVEHLDIYCPAKVTAVAQSPDDVQSNAAARRRQERSTDESFVGRRRRCALACARHAGHHGATQGIRSDGNRRQSAARKAAQSLCLRTIYSLWPAGSAADKRWQGRFCLDGWRK